MIGVKKMKKILASAIILLTSLVAFSNVSEAATVSPATQTIRGSTATANWTFTWNQPGANSVSYSPSAGSSYRVVDSNNTAGFSRISHSYYSQNAYMTYNPGFRAIKKTDGTLEAASATVHKRLP